MRTSYRIFFLFTVCTALLFAGFSSNVLAAGKLRVSVTAFENKVKYVYGGWNLGKGMAEMLTTELARTGQFIVLERMAIGDVVQEQALGQSGLVRQESAVRSGHMLGAQIIIRGAVTEFSDAASGVGGGVQIKRFGMSGRTKNAHVGIDVRVIDAATGQVLASTYASAKAKSAGGRVSYASPNFQVGGGMFSSTPLGQATRGAIADAVSFISASLTRQGIAPKLRIVKVDGGRIYVNAGRDAGIYPGTQLFVYSEGESLIDPETGLNLGSSDEQTGIIEIETVKEKFSIAFPVTGRRFRRGDLLKTR